LVGGVRREKERSDPALMEATVNVKKEVLQQKQNTRGE
jgi:hypothetical protein